jgi:hypothetical protein
MNASDFLQRNGCQPPQKQYYIEKDRRFENDWPPYGFMMIGKEQLKNFRGAINEVNRIPAIRDLGGTQLYFH